MIDVFQNPEQLDWSLTPLEVLARWPEDRPVVMLHSGRTHERWARYSLLAQPVGWFRHTQSSQEKTSADASPPRGRSTWRSSTQTPPPPVNPSRFTHHPLQDLRQILANDAGLWIGYLAYELGQAIEAAVLHPSPTANTDHAAHDDRHWPLIDLACCPGWLVYDNTHHRWTAHGQWSAAHAEAIATHSPPTQPLSSNNRSNRSTAANDHINHWWRTIPALPSQSYTFHAADLRSVFTRHAYEDAVTAVLGYISRGDIFQANLTQRFTATWQGRHPLSQRTAFATLNAVSPAWYGAYLETPPDNDTPQARGRVLASTSPELFLEMDAQRHIITRPIKGTLPASLPAAALYESEKDAAELNMIIDLLRNDLGRVCEYSSVKVTQPRTIETHPTIHHGVATITGTLHPSYDLVDLLKATFPGGSITGAPKIRAMQIIRELEPVTRGPYCGCIGYLTQNTCSLNIAIRTMLIDTENNRVDFSVGGGIVADSTPPAEYDETITKAQAILRTLGLNSPGHTA